MLNKIKLNKKFTVLTLLVSLIIINIIVQHRLLNRFIYQYKPANLNVKKVLLIWGVGTGEQEQTHRFKIAAQRLGIDLKVVSAVATNPFYALYIKKTAQLAADTLRPDLILTIERYIPAVSGYANYLVLDQAKEMYIGKTGDRLVIPDKIIHNYTALLPTFPEIDELKLAFENYHKSFYGFVWYPTVYKTEYLPQDATKLFYPGGVLQDATRSSIKYKKLFSILDSLGYLQVVGKKEKWQHAPNSIQDFIPFDGVSLLEAQNKAGISLVLHDQQHLDGNVPSSRIFEAAAANTVIISDQHQFVYKSFGKNILYIDVTQSAQRIAAQIDQHVKWIYANPSLAKQLANNCHSIFLQHFTLEEQLQRLLALNEKIKAAQNANK